MGDRTGISWCDHTMNFWIGCTKVGPLCDGCYAEREADHRYHLVEWGAGKPRRRTVPDNWKKPLKWNRDALAFKKANGHLPRVFAASWADMADNEVPREWIEDAKDVIAKTPLLRWMITTKRIGNIPKFYGGDFFRKNPHVGVIISAGLQDELERDYPKLSRAKAELGIAWVGISAEPMLGEMHVRKLVEWESGAAKGWSSKTALDWIICGGESAAGMAHPARPVHPQWFRQLRDDCAALGIAFHLKQHGEWLHQSQHPSREIEVDKYLNSPIHTWPDGSKSFRIGSGLSGRSLDGVEYLEFPKGVTL
jgi:protein gp37